MSASRTGTPRSSRASRSMTRTVVNGSPASAMVGGVMAGSGIPDGAGRSGPSPMASSIWGARAASVTWSVISDWSTRDCRVYRTSAWRASRKSHARGERTFTFPISHVHADGACLADRAKRSAATSRSAARQSAPPHEQHDDDGLRSDPDRTDHRPRATGHDTCRARPLPGLGVTGGRPWTRFEAPSCSHRSRAGRDVQRRDRGRTSGSVRFGQSRIDDPGSGHLRAGLRAHPRSLGHPPHQVRRREQPRRQRAHLRRHQRHDRGGRRHRPHHVHDPRGARRSGRTSLSGKYVGIGVRIDVADGRPATRGRRLQGQPGRRRPASPRGDELVAVDGKPTTGHTIDDVAGWVRGEAGTTVKVTVRRARTGRRGT